MVQPVYIVNGKRTPVGSLNGSLSRLSAHQLGTLVISDILSRSEVDPARVDETIMGQVLAAGAGMNPARRKPGIHGQTEAGIQAGRFGHRSQRLRHQ